MPELVLCSNRVKNGTKNIIAIPLNKDRTHQYAKINPENLSGILNILGYAL